MKKIMLALNTSVLEQMISQAENRGISVQELLRAVILPEWFRRQLEAAAEADQNAPNKKSGIQAERGDGTVRLPSLLSEFNEPRTR